MLECLAQEGMKEMSKKFAEVGSEAFFAATRLV